MTEPRTYTTILSFLLASFALISPFLPSPVSTAPLAYANIEVSEPVVEIAEPEEADATIETSKETVPEYDEHTLTNCVAYLRTKGIDIKGVDAVWFKDFVGTTPQVGGIVLLNYDGLWHVAYIEELRPDGVWVSETNYEKGKHTTRLVRWDDEHVKKYLYL